MSYQPEERYWTDYLRIALPVVGLLLMLGLFWFWATNLIGDDDDDTPATVAVVNSTPTATPITAAQPPTETPELTTAGGANPRPTATEPSEGDGNGGDDENPPTETPVAPPDDDDGQPADGEIGAGDIVVVNSDGVNFRPEPNTDGEPIRQLDNGEELTVTGPLQESSGIEWYPVVDKDGVEGFVAAEFVIPVEE